MKKKRTISLLLAIIMLFSVMITPAAAVTGQRGTFYATIPATGWSGKIHPAYSSRDYANNDMTTIYVSEDHLPVKVTLTGENHYQTFELDQYDIYYLSVEDEDSFGRFAADSLLFISMIGWPFLFRDSPHAYATVKIAPPEKKQDKPVINHETGEPANRPATPDSLEDRYKTVLKALDLPFSYSEYTPYGRELKEFFTGGEWDGSSRNDARSNDNYAGYVANRSIYRRTYSWHASNLYNGETCECSVNVDYLGNLETVPGVTSDQDFTLAVDRKNGVIEEWSLLEQRDSWNLDLQGATISKILPLAGDGDDCRAMLYIDDAAGQHIWSLYKGGEVAKLT